MKKLLAGCLLLLSTACSGQTSYGECVGLGKYQDPNLVYEVSTNNAVWAVIFSAGIVIPAVWALEYVYCPVGRKSTAELH